MAHQSLEDTYSLPAAADLSASQYCAVSINGSAQVAITGVGLLPVSVLDNLPKSGEMARIITRSRFVGKIKCGTGGVTAGSKFSCDAAGKAIAGATGAKYFGTAIETRAVGEVATAFFDFSGALGAVP